MNEKLEAIISHYGEQNQIEKAIEELDELKEALRDNHAVEHNAIFISLNRNGGKQ